MATNERNRERKSGSYNFYIHTIISENPLFGTSKILTLEREIERQIEEEKEIK